MSLRGANRATCAATALLAAALALCAASLARAAEPEDFQVLKRLVQEGASATAESRARAYLQAWPQGANRDQVAAWLGQFLAARGEAAAALALLDQPLPKLPPKSRGPANLAKARALLDLRQPARARALLQAPGPLEKEELSTLRRLTARAALDADQPAEAARALLALPSDSRTPDDGIQLAAALALAGDDAGARDVYAGLLQGGILPSEREAEARLALGECSYRLGDFDAARAAVEPLLAGPRAAEARLLQAWTLHRQGEDARAYDAARKAAPLAGWEEGALLAPVRQALLADDPGAMASSAKAFLAARPDSSSAHQAHLALARARELRGDGAGALEELEEALPGLPPGEPKYRAAMAAAALAWEVLHQGDRAARHYALAREAAPGEEERASALLAAARTAWARGASGDALAALATLVKEQAGTAAVPAAYLLLGEIRTAEGAREQGREAFSVVRDSFPDAPEFPGAALALAESAWAESEPGEAASALALMAGLPLAAGQAARRDRLAVEIALAKGDPAAAQAALLQGRGAEEAGTDARDAARFLMGVARLQAGELEGAAETWSSLRDPGRRRSANYRLAGALFAAGKAQEGAALVETLAAAGGPEGRTALFSLSEWRAAAGDDAGARKALRRLAASGDDPLAVLAQRKIEVALLAGEGPEAALAAIPAFAAAEPKSPGRAADLLRAARLRAQSGDPEGAAKLYADYAARYPGGPGAPEAALGVASAAARRRDWRAVRAALEVAPADPRRDLLLGRACYALRDMPTAQAAYERALAATPPAALAPADILEARYQAGMAAAIQGRREAALAHWGAFAKAAPADPAARERLLSVAFWLQKEGAYEPALEAFEHLNAAWRDASVGFQHGYTLELMGRSEEALDAYLKVAFASTNAQWALTARYRAAELMVTLGRPKDAVALYRELAARTEGTVQGDYARKRLAALEASPEPSAGPEAPAPPSPEVPRAPAAPAH